MFDVAVLGPGGVGGFLAAALANARVPTLVVGREPTAREIAERGIAVESERLGAFRAEPGAATALTLPVDVLKPKSTASVNASARRAWPWQKAVAAWEHTSG